jgi:hypothetical protein
MTHRRTGPRSPAVGEPQADLRPRLAAIADRTDPGAADHARAMLAADPVLSGVYDVDGHFVPYTGTKPVGKGRFPVWPALAHGKRRPRCLDHELRHAVSLRVPAPPCHRRRSRVWTACAQTDDGGLVRQGVDSGRATHRASWRPGSTKTSVGELAQVQRVRRRSARGSRPARAVRAGERWPDGDEAADQGRASHRAPPGRAGTGRPGQAQAPDRVISPGGGGGRPAIRRPGAAGS